MKKYTCRCTKRVEKLTSYFIDGVRVTVCDECADNLKLNEVEDKEDYGLIKDSKDPKKYDTRASN